MRKEGMQSFGIACHLQASHLHSKHFGGIIDLRHVERGAKYLVLTSSVRCMMCTSTTASLQGLAMQSPLQVTAESEPQNPNLLEQTAPFVQGSVASETSPSMQAAASPSSRGHTSSADDGKVPSLYLVPA